MPNSAQAKQSHAAADASDRQAFALALLLEQAVRRIYPERGPATMHPGQWAALRYFARANREAATVAGLARYLGVTLAPASRAASALVRKGLLDAAIDPRDRRVTRLTLSDQGRQLLADDPIRRLSDLIGALDGAARLSLAQVVQSLFDDLGESPADI
jgi:DNA-binding MarR family transcriptional regulator